MEWSMPVCFNLTRKGEKMPTNLVEVDQRICTHFSVTCDDNKWYHGWYDSIGFRLALGKTFAEINAEYDATIDKYKDQEDVSYWRRMKEIAEFLDTNYTTDAWREHKFG